MSETKTQIGMTHLGKTAAEMKEELTLKDKGKMKIEIEQSKNLEELKKVLLKYFCA